MLLRELYAGLAWGKSITVLRHSTTQFILTAFYPSQLVTTPPRLFNHLAASSLH